MNLKKIDYKLILFAKKNLEIFARLSLFVIYFWFGFLKVLGFSPATKLVTDLFNLTFWSSFMTIENFMIGFGIFEMIIGIIFLIRKAERLAMVLVLIHLFTTILPLIMLRDEAWQFFLVPTIEGQYIIKNIGLLTVALATAIHLHPLQNNKKVL